jgi:hypothetical protein
MSHHLASVVRSAARNVLASIPKDARRLLDGVKILPGDLGHSAEGYRIEGVASLDGRVILLDYGTVERMDEPSLELLIAHEAAHCVRCMTGQAVADTRRDEIETEQLVRAWGFRRKRSRQR